MKTTRRSLILGTLVKLFRSAKATERLREHQFTELLRPHIELMYRMAYRWTRSEADAEDIVQDVLIRLADRVDEMLDIEQLRPWLIKCVYRRFVDLHRSHASNPLQAESSLFGTHAEMDDEAPSLASLQADARDDYAQLDDRDALLKALATLDDDQRDVILLHDAEGYSASEVAEILGENIGTIKSRLHRARNKLKIFLEAGTF
ncbi:MAG: RNA polymerase sigma factor [Pseudomonadota bacterium]